MMNVHSYLRQLYSVSGGFSRMRESPGMPGVVVTSFPLFPQGPNKFFRWMHGKSFPIHWSLLQAKLGFDTIKDIAWDFDKG